MNCQKCSTEITEIEPGRQSVLRHVEQKMIFETLIRARHEKTVLVSISLKS